MIAEREQRELIPQNLRFARNPDEKWLQQALTKAKEGNRNDVGFWLACQLRDDRISELQARSIILTYANLAPEGREQYTSKEAIASVRSAYSRPPRERAKTR
jgi:putative DNA primase/helicase